MGFMFVIDLTDSGTLYDIIKIISYICETEKNNPKFPATKKLLVGNKIDTIAESYAKDEIDNVVQQFNLKYLETSAMENINVDLAFLRLARDIMTDPKLWHFADYEKGKTKLADRFI